MYGENHDQEEAASIASKEASASLASKKRKAMTEAAIQESGSYNWVDLADNGKVTRSITLTELPPNLILVPVIIITWDSPNDLFYLFLV